jgi:hypothetical protein
MRLLLITGHYVSCADEGTNGTEPLRVIIAGVTLESVSGHGFRAAQPASTVRHDSASVQKHSIDEGLRHGVLPRMIAT